MAKDISASEKEAAIKHGANGDGYRQLFRGVESSRGASELQTETPIAVTPVGISKTRDFYIPVKVKFLVSTSTAILWFLVSLYLAQSWLKDMSNVVGEIPAFLVILFIALIPGFLNAHMLASVLLDSPPPLRTDISFPPVSLLIAAYNEAEN